MSDQPPQGDGPDPQMTEAINELARRIREAEHLVPEVRAEAADLLAELTQSLIPHSPHTEDLAKSAAHYVRAVREKHEPGLVEAAWDRVENAVARAETKAPVTTDVVLRLIDALTGIGI